MYLCYVDESGKSGLDDQAQPLFILGGVVVHETSWRRLNKAMLDIIRATATDLAKVVPDLIKRDQRVRHEWAKVGFPGIGHQARARLTATEVAERARAYLAKRDCFELHAADIARGSNCFFEIPKSERGAIISRAIALLDEHECTFISADLDKKRHRTKYEHRAPAAPVVTMIALVEEFDDLLASVGGEQGMLIADQADDAKRLRGEYDRHIQAETPYSYGTVVRHVIESLHLVDSSHTPLIQLADICTYVLSHERRSTGHWQTQWASLAKRSRKTRRYQF